eukprot:scaffold134575_cov39-Prasinocladus_malaysianus.AAC.1
MLALHYMNFITSAKVVDALLDAHPEGVLRKCNSGSWSMLPLHRALWCRANVQVVKTLLKQCPASAAITDDRKKLPLHHAVRQHEDWELLVLHMCDPYEKILSKYETPEELAEVVELLVEAYPNGATGKDSERRTPLHYA